MRPAALVRVAGWYAVGFSAVVGLEAFRWFLPRATGNWIQVLAVVTGWLWCLRNFLLIPWLGLVFQQVQAGRLAAVVPMRIWTVACAVAFLLTAVEQAGGFDPRIMILGVYVVIGSWLVAWPLYLAILHRRLRRMQRSLQRHGAPKLVGDGQPPASTEA